ncbi:MAG: four helix bundle protein [Thermodesulfobacteriota bacterium]
MNQESLKKRTKDFALRIIKLAEELPASITGKTIANQIIRCGTSVAANYRAACRGRSKAEFSAKLGIVIEEADETCFWLEMIIDAGLFPKEKIETLLSEANELTAIFVVSRKTASANKSSIENRKS